MPSNLSYATSEWGFVATEARAHAKSNQSEFIFLPDSVSRGSQFSLLDYTNFYLRKFHLILESGGAPFLFRLIMSFDIFSRVFRKGASSFWTAPSVAIHSGFPRVSLLFTKHICRKLFRDHREGTCTLALGLPGATVVYSVIWVRVAFTGNPSVASLFGGVGVRSHCWVIIAISKFHSLAVFRSPWYGCMMRYHRDSGLEHIWLWYVRWYKIPRRVFII